MEHSSDATSGFLQQVEFHFKKQPHPHDVLHQQCFMSLGNMSGDGRPKCNGPGGDEAWRTVRRPSRSEQT